MACSVGVMTRHFIIVNKVMLVIQQRWSYLARLGLPAVFHKKNFLKAYKKSFIDQACSVKMAGYLPCCFFSEFMDLDSVSVHKHTKKEQPAILTSHLVNNPYMYLQLYEDLLST